MSRRVPFLIRLRLSMKCGRRCAMPDCKMDLLPKIDNGTEVNISENTHIIGFSDNGPRAEKDLTDSQRNSEANLLVICSNCHIIIDKNPSIYTVEKLLKIKSDHEKEVFEKRKIDASNVGFSELEDVCKFLVSGGITIQEKYTLLTPTEKIKKNNLSPQVADLILHGMIGAHQVGKYLQQHPNPQQGDRIRERFVQEYKRLRNEEQLRDDALFNTLLDFASSNSNEPKKTRGGLAVLVYLFEQCEVFEK